ncbi:glucose-1-phosphate thymidylyltransferase [Nitrosarchaeum sp.]|uniref:glucose-1-phosphate thymidylyltransferase n=1 Tax=Nitrosarchaeum sp. TaxID=2026886 RepID=UPI00247E65C3|nr:glucose-1-phosphate thymidylyltransferase [Nitrosarchaeum sp.]MCV0411899.1 glucose-1-phosphate thymidylyltransferase [Nitrosarchaeum sp.]
MKGILLHGGHGTRLRPLTHTGPKQLLPIANKPMSQYCIESMKDAGIKEIVIIIGGIGANKVKEYYGDGNNFGVKIEYIEQDSPRGIAHAIMLARNFVGEEKFLVFLGDNIIQKSIQEFAREFETSTSDATLLLCKVDNPSRFGIAEIKNNKIVKIIEKPKNPPSDLAVTGIYFLNKKIFDMIENLKPSWRNELEITDALHMLLERGNRIDYHMITDYWKDTGTPEDIINANKEILEKMHTHIEKDVNVDQIINDPIIIEVGAIIENNVKLIGPVLIGKKSIIKSGSVIGPNTSIGDNCLIAKAKIENSIIMNDCKIQVDIKIRNSIIASNSELSVHNDEAKTFLLGEGTRIFL